MKNYAWHQIIKKAYNHRILMEMIKDVRDGLEENMFLLRYSNRKELISKKAEAILFNRYLKENKYEIISIYDEAYPDLLKTIYDPPIAFFFKGNKDLLKKPMIGVIGSRQCPQAYLKKSFNLGRGLAKEEWVVVSGLAKGIEGAAHKGTLSYNGASLGVLGTGININITLQLIKAAKGA